MKISARLMGAALLLTSLGWASAQVTVEVTQEQQQFLLGESLKAAVRITNLSGRDLQLGEDENWLTFALESTEGTVVPKLSDAPVQGAFTLPSSKAAVKRVDLAPCFALPRAGSFQIVATVRIRGWNRELTSPPRRFDMIQGAKLWEQEVGVPKAAASANSEPEIRRYILQQANYLHGHLRLYLRVTDIYGKPISVRALGPLVSFGQPEPLIDQESNLHVLFQEGATSFEHVVSDLNGEVVLRQTYDYVDSRPRLRANDQGTIIVVGGVRRITVNDVPAPKSDDESAAAETESSPAKPTSSTNAELSVTRP